MPKKNGFVMYMESRRPDFLAAGVKLTGGFRQLAELCSDGWQALTALEKEQYTAQAKLFNEEAKKKTGGQSSSQAKVASPPNTKKLTKPRYDPFELTDEDRLELAANREIVNEMFASGKDWLSQPIVICSFSLYFQPEGDPLFLPAEIGLTAMSLMDGVRDNYARIIDPGQIPSGYGIEACTTCDKLGIPLPGSIPELADYRQLMTILESFLKSYEGDPKKGEDLYVFVFDSDFVMVRRCLEWLYKTTKTRLPVKILSLNLYSWNASDNSARALALKAAGQTVDALLQPSNEFATMKMSEDRDVGESLTRTFIYSTMSTTCSSGIFMTEQEVELCIKDMDNYKYYEELCCVYHIKSGKTFHHCALNMSNRYAFSLLEILTLSNDVRVFPGKHYPDVSKRLIEKTRRFRMCERWGITSFEEEMNDDESESSSAPETTPEPEVEGARAYQGFDFRAKDVRRGGQQGERVKPRLRNAYGGEQYADRGRGSHRDAYEGGYEGVRGRSSARNSFGGGSRKPLYGESSSDEAGAASLSSRRGKTTGVTAGRSSGVFRVRGVPQEPSSDDENFDCSSNPYTGNVPSCFRGYKQS